MKTRNALALSLFLATTSIGTAQADFGRHRGYYAPPAYNHDHGHRHGYSRNWGVPAAVLAITGLAIGAAAYQSYQPRPTYVYSAPPVPVQPQPAPDSGNWYFCGSSGVYYPYTRSCPEGWQAVSPPR